MTKHFLSVLAATALVASLGCSSSSGPHSPTINGIFVGSLVPGDPVSQENCGTGTLQATIQQNGSSLSGTWTASGWTLYGQCGYLDAQGPVSGTVSGSTASITLTADASAPNGYVLLGHIQSGSPMSVTGTFTGTLYSGVSSGTFSMTAQ